MKEWFRARNIWGAAIMTLTDEEAGRFVKALFTHTMTGETPALCGAEKAVLALVMMQLAEDERRDAEISSVRAAAGAKGGKQTQARQAIVIADKQTQAKQSNCSNNNHNKDTDTDTEPYNSKGATQKRFTPPTMEEVLLYCLERKNHVNAQKFVDYYTSNGWRVGKNPMKDWKAAVRTWERNSWTEEEYRKEIETPDLPY